MPRSKLRWFIEAVAGRERIEAARCRYVWRSLRLNAVSQFESRFGPVPPVLKQRALPKGLFGLWRAGANGEW
jgi:hypothetical protein